MKYLLFAALLGFIFVFAYSRLRPYIQLLQKILRVMNGEVAGGNPEVFQREGKLFRCPGCGTWTPESKEIKLGGGLVSYCSSVCLEKSSNRKEKKLAG